MAEANATLPLRGQKEVKKVDSTFVQTVKQLVSGGVAGATAKTVTAPFSRLTILFQVHSMVTTKGHRPRFAMSFRGGFEKMVERGGFFSLWRGNGTSVIHRFPYSAINFFVYENMLSILKDREAWKEEKNITGTQLARRMSGGSSQPSSNGSSGTSASTKFLAGATAGSCACIGCYPLDLVRTRLTTQLEGHENYRGIADAFRKIHKTEGFLGFYSGLGPTLLVAVPNFAISYTIYGTLKEYVLDDELFYNIRQVDSESGEPKLGFALTLLCGAASGALSTLATFPFDTIRRRMQIQNLHIPEAERLSAQEQAMAVIRKEGVSGLYHGLTPELVKVIPMVGTMFVVYEWTKEMLGVRKPNR
uniref:ADP,ATP carrier protein n=1 Tax=Grammatophora oceanica TaxID=210454 RepID=A0A7S1YJP2_9STRA|mmetsp:Transcript_50274/g.75073  ORF Transcript_50274/g.75073 Transcript_50274/m.75073 type:complete len:361 (+) Transcript_50274:241-1323(+)|eukprot:CAMPEP_0194047188 /NCGR_PEP_ID=MMETSP0009_2-20130614/23614_1 /TAXON_ID=210454 /ORGANISM="Grammatophora oceanica, Strain CCMP 410" /LENGTH=360 /DNA_ID=CAMNT_0038692725 /DNA_START=241 /DNA_END=1323 /DNA_ORIENTATION=+